MVRKIFKLLYSKLSYVCEMINIIDIELQLIFEEVAKLPRTTDTSYVTPDVLELVYERFFDWENTK